MEDRNAERQMALQRFAAFRSLGDSKRAAEELNKAQGKGLLARMFGNNYNKPEDFDVAGPGLANQMMGARPEVAEDDKMQIAMQAANMEMDRQGGYGGALTKEMKSGYGPKAAALAAKNVQGPEQIGVSDSSLTADVDQYTSPKAVAAQKRVLQVENSQQKYDSMKMSNMQARPLSPDATDQYDFFKQQYDAALATGKQGLIKDAYNDMVHKFKLLDNKWGWNMSSGLKNLRPSFGGSGSGGGPKGEYYINDLTGKRRETSPGTDAQGNLPQGWRRISESTDQASIKMYEDIIKNPDSTPEQVKDAEVRLGRYRGEREKREILTNTPLRGATGFATGIDYQGGTDYEGIAAGPNNKNQGMAQPKGKTKLARDERGVMWDVTDPKNPKRVE
jgi:hypothetical protein